MSFSFRNTATHAMRETPWTNPAASPARVRTDWNVLYPLSEFYEESGLPLPGASMIAGQDVPQPYKRLLVHERDMTPTLEAAYGQTIHLRVLKHSLRDDVFSREVVLVLGDQVTAVEFGGINIYLEYLPEEARRLVLERRLPLGTILQTQRIAHENHPSAYLRVTPDPVIREAFGLREPRALYGRCNVLLDPSQNVLARVVEILPPADRVPALENGRG
jgi:chorismate-pyruvate lyase